MKYMLTWSERPQGSPIEYENAQKRILEVFTQWKAPANFKIELFVIRVGDWGGYMMLDCDEPAAVHKFCSMLPAFVFEARPVIPIEDDVGVAHHRLQPLGGAQDHAVADQMAVGVVDRLEAIDVGEAKYERLAGLLEVLHPPRQRLVEMAAVGDAGHRVGGGLLLRLGEA